MAIFDQGTLTGAKQGTVFLGIGATFTLKAIDLSQEFTDLTDNGTGMSETPAPRFDRSHPRTIYTQIELDTTSSGTIYFQAAAGNETSIVADGAGTLEIRNDGVLVGSVAVDGLTGGATLYEVAWVSIANPDSETDPTGVLSWILIWDVSAGLAQRAGPFVHAVKPVDTAEVSWGEDAGGGNVFNEQMNRCGFHHRAMTLAEIHNDFITPTSEPVTLAEIEREPIPLTFESGAGNRNEVQGPPGAWASHSMRRLRRRTVTGRSIRLDAVTLSTTYHTGNSMVRLAVGSTVYRWRMGWLFAVPVAPVVSHLFVRLHADLWVTGGAAVPFGFRVYSANRPGQLHNPIGSETYEQVWAEDIVTRDDGGAGSGVWSFAENLKIRRGTEGERHDWTYIHIGYAIDPEETSGNIGAARAIINAIVIAPHYEEPAPGGPVEGGESG